MKTYTLTLTGFIAATGMKMKFTQVDSNPHWTGDKYARHFRCTLGIPKHGSMSLVFSQGSGIKEDPALSGVLSCLSAEAAGFENTKDFESWASEYGYDTDSRSAEKTFKAVERQTDKLKKFLSGITVGDDEDDAYDVLLWHTEAL